MNQFLNRLGPNDRALLVGDIRQHQAIGAGAPFQQFQRAGMHTAIVDNIQRQQDPELRKAVQLFAKGKAREAAEMLIDQGRVTEIVDDKQRMTAIAKDYASDNRGLVISMRNEERAEHNQAIHAALQRAGKIEKEDHAIGIYLSRDMSKKEREFAGAYQIGDHVRYGKGSKEHGIKAREYWEVVGVNPERNTLTVMHEDGRSAEYNPKRLRGVAVYYPEERQFAVGDRVQFRAPFTEKGIPNNSLAYVEGIEGRRITLRMDDEKQKLVKFDISNFRHLDHGYAVTPQSAQGLSE